MSVIVMNFGERGSQRFHVAPDAEIDDGLLDVLVMRADSPSRMVRLVWRLARRAEPSPRDALRAQGAEVRIQWDRAVPTQRDGDHDETVRSVTAHCRPSALRIHHG